MLVEELHTEEKKVPKILTATEAAQASDNNALSYIMEQITAASNKGACKVHISAAWVKKQKNPAALVDRLDSLGYKLDMETITRWGQGVRCLVIYW